MDDSPAVKTVLVRFPASRRTLLFESLFVLFPRSLQLYQPSQTSPHFSASLEVELLLKSNSFTLQSRERSSYSRRVPWNVWIQSLNKCDCGDSCQPSPVMTYHCSPSRLNVTAAASALRMNEPEREILWEGVSTVSAFAKPAFFVFTWRNEPLQRIWEKMETSERRKLENVSLHPSLSSSPLFIPLLVFHSSCAYTLFS